MLQAVGLDPHAIRRLFVGEALVLSIAGGLVGMAGAVAYGWLIMLGLRTWWVDAVGTTALALHVDPLSLIAGAAAVVLIAVASIWWSLAVARKKLRPFAVEGVRPYFSGKHETGAAVGVSDRSTEAVRWRCLRLELPAQCRGLPRFSARAPCR